MNERDLQHAVYDYRHQIQAYPLMVPNVYHFYWESDLLYVSNTGYLSEFEIKLTKSDFRADAKKFKHHYLGTPNSGLKEFWYVVPTGLVDIEDVPDHAGLMYVEPRPGHYPTWQSPFRATLIKKAVQNRKASPVTADKQLLLAKKGCCRWWTLSRHILNKSIEIIGSVHDKQEDK